MLPQILLNASSENPKLNGNDYVGWILWLVGFISETMADFQKYSYKNDPKNKGHWCDEGIWKFSRWILVFYEYLVIHIKNISF